MLLLPVPVLRRKAPEKVPPIRPVHYWANLSLITQIHLIARAMQKGLRPVYLANPSSEFQNRAFFNLLKRNNSRSVSVHNPEMKFIGS